jgi:hypothetical protein
MKLSRLDSEDLVVPDSPPHATRSLESKNGTDWTGPADHYCAGINIGFGKAEMTRRYCDDIATLGSYFCTRFIRKVTSYTFFAEQLLLWHL